jgi:hypothetical protein
MATFYLLYLIVLRRETFHQLNRFYLMLSVLCSITLPLMPSIRIFSSDPVIVNLIENISFSTVVNVNKIKSPELINPVLFFYLGGLCWFALRFFSGLGKIIYLLHRFPSVRTNGKKTVILEGDHAPFTFFNILFACQKDLKFGADESIIRHEMAHIRQIHSVDFVLIELATIVHWFNPFIWLIRISLKAEHEYEADNCVMKEGYNRSGYQQLLFEKTMGIPATVLANNFNYSLLKNRIKMLYKNKSAANARLKYLLILPVFMIVMTFINLDLSLASLPDDTVFDEVSVMPEYPGGMQAMSEHLFKNINYPAVAKEQAVEGKVFVQFIVFEDGSINEAIAIRSDIVIKIGDEILIREYSTTGDKNASEKKDGIIALEEESVRVVSSLANFKPGLKDGIPVKVRLTIPISFALK